MATAGNIISAASLKINVESPTTAQQATALTSLNNMIQFWGVEKLNFAPTSESLSIGTSTSTYTLASAGDSAAMRPNAILKCFLNDSDGYDWPVDIMSSDEYNRMSYKSYSARPTKLYFLPEFPLAKVVFNSIPDAAYTAYFELQKEFAAFASTTSTIGATFPNSYLEALVYNLAVSLGEDWDRKVSPTVIARAQETKAALDAMNAANRPVAKARFDMNIGSTYNITTDM